MSDIEITFADGSQKRYPKYTTYEKISHDLENSQDIIGVCVNNKIASLKDTLDSNCKVEFLSLTDMSGNRIYSAGIKMVFEYALKKTFPLLSVRYSYSLPRGIVAQIISDKYLLNDDISLIRKKMASVVSENIPIEKLNVKAVDGIKYYEEYHNVRKADNIKNQNDATIIMYRLDDLINYYYSEMPLSTGLINKYEIKYLGKNLVVINFPGEYDNGVLPEYVNYKGILNSYVEGQKWLETMNVPYINDINHEISLGRIKNFIKSSELNFNLSINEAAKHISENSNIKCVMLAGPSSSGKTTVTQRLANYCEIYGLDPIVISIDDYFRERVNCPKDENGEYDFECLQAIDVEYIANDVVKLFNGETINLPRFNFVTGCKELTGKKIKLKDNSVILFEGIHALNDDLLPMIPDMIKYKIYVSPFIPLCLDEHNYISCYDLRLLRRIVRDFNVGSFGVKETLSLWEKVRKGEEKNIIPFVHQANLIINTSLPYEVGALKVFVEPLLYSITSDSIYYNEARRLISFLKPFFPISSEHIPKDSIVREFIGGNND